MHIISDEVNCLKVQLRAWWQSPFPQKPRYGLIHSQPLFKENSLLSSVLRETDKESKFILIPPLSPVRVLAMWMSVLLPEVTLPQVPRCGVADHLPAIAWLSQHGVVPESLSHVRKADRHKELLSLLEYPFCIPGLGKKRTAFNCSIKITAFLLLGMYKGIAFLKGNLATCTTAFTVFILCLSNPVSRELT